MINSVLSSKLVKNLSSFINIPCSRRNIRRNYIRKKERNKDIRKKKNINKCDDTDRLILSIVVVVVVYVEFCYNFV